IGEAPAQDMLSDRGPGHNRGERLDKKCDAVTLVSRHRREGGVARKKIRVTCRPSVFINDPAIRDRFSMCSGSENFSSSHCAGGNIEENRRGILYRDGIGKRI